ncbi:uncharacterized protein B0H18DRAFT_1037361 [Fomitopsis serialis]|uniref:uncharacterized protein n=1 Tax=Fomitopsis serialis TaxID=139415 RepID=UPI00200726E7|nr:uncharacterized protein B0H18DRAFT_1037361 [Neoantrodia serialis]KAH9916825.1 hypothetical protein B0H18DRAFT_1037361 [Neoantrodia serialis]
MQDELKERHDIRDLIDELRNIVKEGRDTKCDQELRKKLSAVESITNQLRSQLRDSQHRICELEASNDVLKEKATRAETARSGSDEDLRRAKARFVEEARQNTLRLQETDDDVCFLENMLDEMEDRARGAEQDQGWLEHQLALCSQHIQELLGEISDQQKVRQQIEDNATTAFLRGSSLNKWVTRKTQEELAKAKAKEASLLIEVVELKEQIGNSDKAEASEKPNIESGIASQGGECPSDDVVVGNTASLSTISHDDPRLYMTPGGVLEDMFRALSNKEPNLRVLSEFLGIRNIVIVTPAEFVWASCPDTGHFVKPALFHGKGGKWQDAKLKSIKRLQKQGPTEVIPYFSGAYYYVGTYTVGEAEHMNVEEFERLPEKTQRGVVGSSGKPTEYGSLRELYLGGKLSALKFPVRRTGFNSKLNRYLRQNA